MSARLTVIGAAIAATLLLGGCASAAPMDDAPAKESAPSTAPEDHASESAPITQEKSCGWESARLPAGSAEAPSSPGDDLATALIGSWQHTHIDSGAGFEPLAEGTDIRFVFPSATELLYCQDVAGATSQAENSATVQLDGANIVLPAPATGYVASAWSADTMLWTNNRDGSLYLLKRR